MTLGKNNKIIVAVSGSGRSLENLARRAAEAQNFQIIGVISSSQTCRGVEIAKAMGVDVFYDAFSQPLPRSSHDALRRWLAEKNPALFVLAGFIRKFPIFKELDERVINIHPALLPKFGGVGMYGSNVHRAVLAAGEKHSGATVHYVDEEYDRGRILAQIRVDVKSLDSAEDLAARVFAAECELYPRVIEDLLSGVLPLADKGIKIYD